MKWKLMSIDNNLILRLNIGNYEKLGNWTIECYNSQGSSLHIL